MRRAGALVAERRLPEAEAEIIQALSAVPGDLRALKLLALVRFRLGRFAEAREAYRAVAHASPDDAAARLNLGLIALKLEWFAEAVEELAGGGAVAARRSQGAELSRLRPRARGRSEEAAQAFRRAGQPELAAELEGRGVAPPPDEARLARAELSKRETIREFGHVRTEVTQVELVAAPAPAARLADAGTERAAQSASLSLSSFVLGRLLTPDEPSAGSEWVADGVYRFPVAGEAHVSVEAVLAAEGGLALERARRRQRGRVGDERLGAQGPRFYRCDGSGELWLTTPRPGGGVMALNLEEDVLYLREELVLAFSGELVWESGCVPRTRMPLLHFRGSGRVLIGWRTSEPVAVRVTEPRRVTVAQQRLCGWIGRVVVHGLSTPSEEPDGALVACEGEGVLLIARHGQAVEPVHQRAELSDDGTRAPDPRGAAPDR